MKKIFSHILKSVVALSFVFATTSTFAQEAAAQKQKVFEVPQMLFDPVTYIWMLLAFILFVTILVLSSTINQLSRIIEGEKELTEEAVTVKERTIKKSAWSKFISSMMRSVPVEHEKDVMLDHNYDGIQELDNQLPPWWKYGFYITILFAFVYLTVYHISGSAKLQNEEYLAEMKQADLEKKMRMEQNASYVTDANVTRLTDAAVLAEGHELFSKNCAACHGDKGQGNVGPNLTDEFWIHGGGIKNIFHTITEGVPAKGMISWKNQFPPKKIQALASYIMTLEGTHPEGGKEPQGDKWVVTETVDTTKTTTDTTQVIKGVALN